ncbi:hypothetical protein KHC23_13115 [Ancylobacter dichloromethanicus]|uniref:Uncharacterized protein n=1 Tax=Ancylobacter dichloromethanicus TaxID=518825 RepID=A0A9W6MYJ2_9HYPH|nr:hypothetical protein [Ancylobacter dichloromethanicus]MBS7554594.1 hypothetical protein [Ancylobacter dichloromethanicus]GLK71724.1 hypothetical protein GCM10017643_18390 [Ancylobacter dichloromethanicus]
MCEDHERIVFDRQLGVLLLQKRHNRVHGSIEQIEALAAFLIRAAYEARKGLHEAPPLPRSTWRPGEIDDSTNV